ALKEEYAQSPGNETKADASSIRNTIAANRLAWKKEFVKNNPSTYAALEVFSTYAIELSDDDLEKQFAALPDTYKSTPLGIRMSEKIAGASANKVGNKAFTFSEPGIDGQLV